LWLSTPACHRGSFGKKVGVIIDCFEIFIEHLSNLEGRASTWYSYKHHNTVDVLSWHSTTRSSILRIRSLGRLLTRLERTGMFNVSCFCTAIAIQNTMPEVSKELSIFIKGQGFLTSNLLAVYGRANGCIKP